jgi:membrane protease YdiL (CAAX protease family)
MKNITKNILIFISYFIYVTLFKIILYSFGLNFNNLNMNQRVIFIMISAVIFMGIITFLYRKELLEELKDFKTNFKKHISKNIILYLIGILLMGTLNVIISKITNQSLSENESQIREYIKNIPIYMIFSTVIYSPYIEELIFRKSLKNIFKFKYLFIILSGIIFGLAHITDPSNMTELLFSIPYIVMGIIFALIYSRTNNIFTTITFHLCHNLILLIIQFL